jgi:beta-lactamase class A
MAGMRALLSFALTSIVCGCAANGVNTTAPPAQSEPSNEPSSEHSALWRALAARCDELDGRVGVYAQALADPVPAFERNADEVFPTASLVKVPILVGLFARIERGELDLHQQLVFEKSRSRGGEDLLASFEEGATISLDKLVHLMIAFSDNSASLWCQELAGGGEAINAWLAEHGYVHTRVNSRTPGREEDFQRFGWGQTSPREMCALVASIRTATCISPRADEEMYRVMCRAYWDSEALSALPPWVQAASKQGAINRSRSEVVLVNAPSGDYVFCVITNDQVDQSWGADNAGFVLLRDVSALLWRHFEGDAWAPAPGVEEWR